MKIKKLKKILVDRFTLKKTADIHLLDDEFVTFRDKKQEYDFSKKLGLLHKSIFKQKVKKIITKLQL